MKTGPTLIACLLFINMQLNGQAAGKLNNNAVSFELGKTGLIYSLGFDHKLATNFGLRVTMGTNFSNYLKAFSTFAGGYYLFGKNKNYLELGVDIGYLSVKEVGGLQRNFAFIFPDYTIKTYYTNLNIGYRKYGNKTLLRMGVSPGYCKSGPLPGAYISYGITF